MLQPKTFDEKLIPGIRVRARRGCGGGEENGFLQAYASLLAERKERHWTIFQWAPPLNALE